MHLSVWAPSAGAVTARIDGAEAPMHKVAGGWWRADDGALAAGTLYSFSLDGGPFRPDPRSCSQPEGVDGPSELVDPGAFRWSDGSWRGLPLPGAVLYELHVGTFSEEGTFDGVVAHLPHLVGLGVDAIELMPVAEFPGRHGWGYDGVDLFAPHHAYGGPNGLNRLVDACHARGLGVILDVVYNHLGPSGNHLPEFGPYFSERHRTNWGAALNFDGPESDEVRRFVVDNALMWLRDYHIDGLRLDAVHAIHDESPLHVLEELAREVDALAASCGRHKFVIAESDLNDPRLVRSRDAGGFGLAASWADEWHHALHATLTGERDGYYEDFGRPADLAKALRQGWVHDGAWSEHRRRHFGGSPAGIDGDRFVVCTQNHDQVGNRASGERSSLLMSEGRLRVAASLLLTTHFTPMLFQGEEWGAATPFLYFTDHEDEALGRAVTAGRRSEFASFGWDPAEVPDPQEDSTFARSKLDWAELDRHPHADILGWYRTLIALRRELGLSDPRLERTRVELVEAAGVLALERDGMILFANIGAAPHSFAAGSALTLVAASGHVDQADGTVVVPPDAVAIFRRGPGHEQEA